MEWVFAGAEYGWVNFLNVTYLDHENMELGTLIKFKYHGKRFESEIVFGDEKPQ